MFVVGIAGHIDHGKSAFIRALTHIDPDRLPEEKRRGKTIDLGYVYLPLASGEVVGIIDVPGHKDLMRNAIVGMCSIKAVLLIVAAGDIRSGSPRQIVTAVGDGAIAAIAADKLLRELA